MCIRDSFWHSKVWLRLLWSREASTSLGMWEISSGLSLPWAFWNRTRMVSWLLPIPDDVLSSWSKLSIAPCIGDTIDCVWNWNSVRTRKIDQLLCLSHVNSFNIIRDFTKRRRGRQPRLKTRNWPYCACVTERIPSIGVFGGGYRLQNITFQVVHNFKISDVKNGCKRPKKVNTIYDFLYRNS